MAAEVTNAANAPKVQAAAKKMIDQVTRLTPMIDNLPNDAVITFKNNVTMTGAELKDWWRRANFLVTDRTDFGMDRAGAVVGTLSQFNADAVLGWDAHPNGLAFIMLHEIVHMTPAARAFDLQMWTAHNGPLSTYNRHSPQFVENEQYANYAAREILRAVDSDFTDLADPNPGETDPTRQVPPYRYPL